MGVRVVRVGEARGGRTTFVNLNGRERGRRRCILNVPEKGSDTEVSEQHGAIIINQEVGRLDVAVHKPVSVQVAWHSHHVGKCIGPVCGGALTSDPPMLASGYT